MRYIRPDGSLGEFQPHELAAADQHDAAMQELQNQAMTLVFEMSQRFADGDPVGSAITGDDFKQLLEGVYDNRVGCLNFLAYLIANQCRASQWYAAVAQAAQSIIHTASHALPEDQRTALNHLIDRFNSDDGEGSTDAEL